MPFTLETLTFDVNSKNETTGKQEKIGTATLTGPIDAKEECARPEMFSDWVASLKGDALKAAADNWFSAARASAARPVHIQHRAGTADGHVLVFGKNAKIDLDAKPLAEALKIVNNIPVQDAMIPGSISDVNKARARAWADSMIAANKIHQTPTGLVAGAGNGGKK